MYIYMYMLLNSLCHWSFLKNWAPHSMRISNCDYFALFISILCIVGNFFNIFILSAASNNNQVTDDSRHCLALLLILPFTQCWQSHALPWPNKWKSNQDFGKYMYLSANLENPKNFDKPSPKDGQLFFMCKFWAYTPFLSFL